MADIAAIENKKTIPVIIVEKVPADEAPAEAAVKKATEAAEESSDVVSTTAQNGNGAAVASENGDCEADAVVSEEAVAVVEATTEADAAEIAEETAVPAEEAAVAENGDGKVAVDIAEEANVDATDAVTPAAVPSTPTAEALKRKAAINADDEKTDEKDAATPEKKAKLDEISKEELQNGSEKSEVAA